MNWFYLIDNFKPLCFYNSLTLLVIHIFIHCFQLKVSSLKFPKFMWTKSRIQTKLKPTVLG